MLPRSKAGGGIGVVIGESPVGVREGVFLGAPMSDAAPPATSALQAVPPTTGSLLITCEYNPAPQGDIAAGWFGE